MYRILDRQRDFVQDLAADMRRCWQDTISWLEKVAVASEEHGGEGGLKVSIAAT